MRLEIDTNNKTIKVKEINPNMGELMTELMELLPDWADYKIVSVGIEIDYTPPTPDPIIPNWPTTPTPTWPNRPGDFWYDAGPTVITNESTWDYGSIL